MVKLKPILPTLKENKRYLVYEVISKKTLKKDISMEIVKKLKEFLGVFDSADAGIQSIEYDQKTQRGVIRVGTKQIDKLKVSLALITQLNNEEATIKSIGASGILKKAKNKYMAG